MKTFSKNQKACTVQFLHATIDIAKLGQRAFIRNKLAIQKLVFACLVVVFFSQKTLAQNVGIGTNSPHSSALLDMVSNNKGLSVPSMNSAQRSAIANPKTGLIVFDAEKNTLCMFNGANWVFFSTSVDPVNVQPTEQIASDGNVGDELGCSVAIDGNYAIAGAHFANIFKNSNQGAAYVYFFNGTNWVEQAKLTASDGAAGDNFGISVSISGDYAVVGANLDDVGTKNDQGSVYIFHRSGTAWPQEAHVFSSNGAAGDNFGTSVGISFDYLVAGAPGDDISTATNRGSAYFFMRSGIAWTQQNNVIGPFGAANDHFGTSVSITGDQALIGSPDSDYDDGNGPRTDNGTAHVFNRVGSNWSHQQLLFWKGSIDDTHFGAAVSIANNIAAIGADFAPDPTSATGWVRIFEYDGSAWQWSTGGEFIIGSNAPMYEKNGALFGHSIFTNAVYTIIGAPQGDTTTIFKGNTYVFQTDGTAWYFLRKIADPAGGFKYEMGSSVALSGNYCIIGARGASAYRGKILFLKLN